MTRISRLFGASLTLGLALAAGAGCELITAVDRDGIPGSGGAGQGGGTTSQGGAGQGGGGASQGGGGSGSDCTNGVKDGAETDVDCGGGQCSGCATGQVCAAASDCLSGKCTGDVCADVLLISEVRSRGLAGADDEFVELYNPTGVDVTTDDTWKLVVRSALGGNCGTNGNQTTWMGAGEVIPSHSHLLIRGSNYNQQPDGDATLIVAVPDAASIRLEHGTDVVDALCFQFDATTLNNLTTCSTAYVCEGTPALNPHDNTGGTSTDDSLERKPGSTNGNTTDRGDSSSDFAAITPALPENLASPPTP